MTAAPNAPEVDSRIQTFISRLERTDSGERALLKRNAGQPLAEARDVLGLFYRLLPPNVYPGIHELYFMVATLYPLAEGGRKRNLGATLRAARTSANGPGLDRRVDILLDADIDQLPFRLRQSVRFAQSNRRTVDWAALLSDVLQWNHPDRWVQRRWAQSYYGESTPDQSGRNAIPTDQSR
jgi:CRISPR system Cascade subunit CasB